jgi:ribosomal protein L7/L12
MKPIPPEAMELADRGEFVEAIKVMRERTGLGLKDAKDTIDAYRRNPQFFRSPETEDRYEPAEHAGRAEESVEINVPPAAVTALDRGRLIDAIKATREANPGLGLKDAKEAVEAFLENNPATQREFKSAASESFRRVAGNWLFVFAVVGVVVIAYWYLKGGNG